VIWAAVTQAMSRHWFAVIVLTLGIHLFWHLVFKGFGVALHHFRLYWLAWLFDVES
jgi:hypothetical protein